MGIFTRTAFSFLLLLGGCENEALMLKLPLSCIICISRGLEMYVKCRKIFKQMQDVSLNEYSEFNEDL